MSTISAITYDNAVAVTPSDTVDDTKGPFAGFYSGDASAPFSIRVLTAGGNDVTLAGLSPGVVVTLAIRRVFVTGTTATNVIGMMGIPYAGRH